MNRRTFVASTAAALSRGGRRVPVGLFAARRPRPTAAQLQWQRDEMAMFTHFGMNTFTDREWGDGTEDPARFDPTALDTRQWAKSARVAGFRAMILTAKHHDGFCLWPTATTRHSVASSPFRNGQGDVVREFVDACHAEGLRPGLYLSPWDRNNPTYGDSPRYNDLYATQLTELLTRYGRIAEVWFDGANGEGPNGKKQTYDWPRVHGIVRRLQPDAVIFSDAGPDVRWCGNENGSAGDPNWSTVDPEAVPYPGVSGPNVTASLQHGDPAGSVWRPAEVDVSIRPGWFHHDAEDAKVRSADNLVALYLSSVGRNGKLLLNVPPTRDGDLAETDVARLATMRQRLDMLFAADLAHGKHIDWRRTGARAAQGSLDLGVEAAVSAVRLEENIAKGQLVARHSVQARVKDAWQTVYTGTTIGNARIARFDPVNARQFRLTIDAALDTPAPITIKLYS